MPIKLNLDAAIFQWQAKHGEKMTYAELAKRARITEPTIYRLTSGQPTKLDLGKLNRICKVLECEPGDLLDRVDTRPAVSIEEVEWRMQQRYEDLATLKKHMPPSEVTDKETTEDAID
ncbi:MAG: helix-turn-helix transcriptional regulator [Chloroflexota bacterium]